MIEKPGTANATRDSDFADVDGGSLLSFPCSPELEDGFLGLRINAPKIVTILPLGERNHLGAAFAKIVICGAYALKYEDSRDIAPDRIVIVAKNDETGRIYRSDFGRLQHPGVDVDPAPMPEDMRRHLLASRTDPESITGGYFNPDIAHFIPEYPGTYTVYAQLGSFKSNEVMIEIRGKADRVHREGAPRSDEAFNSVEELSDQPFPCTPRLDEDFVGIRINAPTVVKIGKLAALPASAPFAKIMVCGAYSLTEMNAVSGAPDYFTVVFFNRRLGEGFGKNIGTIYSENGMKTPQAPARARRGFFNINVGRMGRPASYGIYTLMVSTSDAAMRSNEIAVELVE